MRTCDGDNQVHHTHLSLFATQVASYSTEKEGHGMDNKNTSDGTHRNFRRIRLIVRHVSKKREIRTFSRTPSRNELYAQHNIRNNSGQAHLQRSTTSPSPQRRPAATLKPDHITCHKRGTQKTVLRDYKAHLQFLALLLWLLRLLHLPHDRA